VIFSSLLLSSLSLLSSSGNHKWSVNAFDKSFESCRVESTGCRLSSASDWLTVWLTVSPNVYIKLVVNCATIRRLVIPIQTDLPTQPSTTGNVGAPFPRTWQCKLTDGFRHIVHYLTEIGRNRPNRRTVDSIFYRKANISAIYKLLRCFCGYVFRCACTKECKNEEFGNFVVSVHVVPIIGTYGWLRHRETKRLHGLKNCTYQERLKRLNILSLELRRLHADLILTYRILFGHVDIDVMLICLIFVLLQHEDISLNCLSIIQTTVHVRRFSVSAL